MTFRPSLRPGAPLLRRDARHLQVGTSPGIVIVDRPGLLPFLRLLDGVRDVPRLEQIVRERLPSLDGQVRALLTELRALGAVVDASATRRPAPWAGAEVALRCDAGSRVLDRAARSVLTASGLARLDSAEPALLVLISSGEPPREPFERATLLRTDHLPVVVDEDRVRIGPLVSPGRTPCVGCHDLHRADWDPAWPALLHQLGRPATPVGPSARAPLTAHAASVELAAEVLAHATGGPLRTLGRCLVVGPDHDDRTTWPVAFHHGCSCDLLNAA